MSLIKDLVGQKFNRLLVIRDSGRRNKPRGGVIWECKCDCGNTTYAMGCQLKSNVIMSCGCYNREVVSKLKTRLTHGYSGTPTHTTWRALFSRCYNKKDDAYKNYGARGIKVCKRWRKFENFLEDMGERPTDMTIDRIDNNGDYFKENCRWASDTEQCNNRRSCVYFTINGETKSMKDWCRVYDVNYKAAWARYNRGWSIEDCLTKPRGYVKRFDIIFNYKT